MRIVAWPTQLHRNSCLQRSNRLKLPYLLFWISEPSLYTQVSRVWFQTLIGWVCDFTVAVFVLCVHGASYFGLLLCCGSVFGTYTLVHFCYGSLWIAKVREFQVELLSWTNACVDHPHFSFPGEFSPCFCTAITPKERHRSRCVLCFQHLFTGLANLFWLDVFNVSYSSISTLV